jgi:hypothetical protein
MFGAACGHEQHKPQQVLHSRPLSVG